MLYAYANLGFDTQKGLWFADLFGYNNESMGLFVGKSIVVKNGSGLQVQWPSRSPTETWWHIREQVYAVDLQEIYIDGDDNIVVEFKPDYKSEDVSVPEDWAVLRYAYSLKNSGKGFVEFCTPEGGVLKKLAGRWIVVENLDHVATGIYPNIRFQAKREDVDRVVVTSRAVVVVGKQS